MHYIIKIENYNRPSRTIQCFKCQYFHHSSSHCKMNFRCVKCPENHDYRTCPLGKNGDNNKVICVNCKGNHTANFRGCQKFPKSNRTFNSSVISSNKSFANAVANAKVLPPPQKHVNSAPLAPNPATETFNSLTNVLNEIAQEFNVSNFQELIIKYRNLLLKLKSTTDPLLKLKILAETIEPTLKP